jgi:PHD/YefM family antitoxin component YafN of YafNO toxin-antitoxin module
MILHPQDITDATGKRVSVSLPAEEYDALIERLEDLEDLEDLADAREALEAVRQGREETIPWEAIKAEYGL